MKQNKTYHPLRSRWQQFDDFYGTAPEMQSSEDEATWFSALTDGRRSPRGRYRRLQVEIWGAFCGDLSVDCGNCRVEQTHRSESSGKEVE